MKTIQVSPADFVKPIDIGVQTEGQQCGHEHTPNGRDEIGQLKKELSECRTQLDRTIKSKFGIETI